jgi:hypothetical protein
VIDGAIESWLAVEIAYSSSKILCHFSPQNLQNFQQTSQKIPKPTINQQLTPPVSNHPQAQVIAFFLRSSSSLSASFWIPSKSPQLLSCLTFIFQHLIDSKPRQNQVRFERFSVETGCWSCFLIPNCPPIN